MMDLRDLPLFALAVGVVLAGPIACTDTDRQQNSASDVLTDADAQADAADQPRDTATSNPDTTAGDTGGGTDGDVCLEPDTGTTPPVKLLFLVDASSSLQYTDPDQFRYDALEQTAQSLSTRGKAKVAFASFSAQIDVADADEPFQADPSGFRRSSTNELGAATDYQGALATAHELLREDMMETDAETVEQTQYIVHLISDGTPEPVCGQGCDDDESGVCNSDQDIDEGYYVDFQKCGADNQPETLESYVDKFQTIADDHSAAGFTFHSTLLYREEGIPDVLDIDVDAARSLLERLTDAGGGNFQQIDTETASDDAFDPELATEPTPNCGSDG